MTELKKDTELEKLADILVQLVQIFRQGETAANFQWWQDMSHLFYPMYGYQNGKTLFEEVIKGILKRNPEMLSEHAVKRRTIYSFLQQQAIKPGYHLYGEILKNEAKRHLHEMIEFKAWQNVDIPIANLWVRGQPIKVFNVTFFEIEREELEQWKKRGLWSDRSSEVHVVARVRAPGDTDKALTYSKIKVNLTLDIFRAFCLPFYRDSSQMGIIGDISSLSETPFRINEEHFTTRLGSGIAQIELIKHILSKLEQSKWALINRLLLKKETIRSPMENKLLDGIHWLSESTKIDTNNSKFAKISFSLETLLGGEPQDEELKVRGITDMLAERASFIAGANFSDRLAIDRDIRKYYGKRGRIVHGGKGEASLDDIEKFGKIVRRIAVSLLEKLDQLGDEIKDIEKFGKWIRDQRYTLPEQ